MPAPPLPPLPPLPTNQPALPPLPPDAPAVVALYPLPPLPMSQPPFWPSGCAAVPLAPLQISPHDEEADAAASGVGVNAAAPSDWVTRVVAQPGVPGTHAPPLVAGAVSGEAKAMAAGANIRAPAASTPPANVVTDFR
jgi:hypothetical protein